MKNEHMQYQDNTLAYLRPARKAADGSDGELWVHRWPTGAQELIFVNTSHARAWLFGSKRA